MMLVPGARRKWIPRARLSRPIDVPNPWARSTSQLAARLIEAGYAVAASRLRMPSGPSASRSGSRPSRGTAPTRRLPASRSIFSSSVSRATRSLTRSSTGSEASRKASAAARAGTCGAPSVSRARAPIRSERVLVMNSRTASPARFEFVADLEGLALAARDRAAGGDEKFLVECAARRRRMVVLVVVAEEPLALVGVEGFVPERANVGRLVAPQFQFRLERIIDPLRQGCHAIAAADRERNKSMRLLRAHRDRLHVRVRDLREIPVGIECDTRERDLRHDLTLDGDSLWREGVRAAVVDKVVLRWPSDLYD